MFMEDEGRYFCMKTFATRLEAQEWIDAYDKHFGPDVFIITERSHG